MPAGAPALGPLLTTKLQVPLLRPELVPRPRLLKRLDEGVRRNVTLVSAPAGFGKTTLISEWAHRRERDAPAVCVAWLSLDGADNDPVRFSTYLSAALHGADPHIGQSALAMLHSPQPPPPEAMLIGLINDMAALPHTLVLVLDDYHLISAQPVHQQVAFLLEHQPPSTHLIIGAREDPPLPLARLRARGQMIDIRQADLRFTEEETADFLRRVMGLDVAPEDVGALRRRTEGWIAGLQLAALSMQGRDDVHQLVQSLSGSHRYILDYLVEEVFQQQPADVQGFLLRTSILDRLAAPLCDAVLQSTGSQQMLERLETANLFIVALDQERCWYRYHRLWADLLRHRLQRVEGRKREASLHRQASRWYEAEGHVADAIHHALAGSDWERAAGLIHSASETMLRRGEVATLLGWFRLLPEDEVTAHPSLCLQYGWALILTGEIGAAELLVERAERASSDNPSLANEIVFAKAYIARARGDDRRTIELSEKALPLLPEEDHNARGVVGVNLGIALWNCGRLEEAEQALDEAQREADRSQNHYASLTALVFLASIRASRGNLSLAAQLCRQAIERGKQLPAIGHVHIIHGALQYEWNELVAAADEVMTGIGLSQRSDNPEVQCGGYRVLARVRQAQGDAAAALLALHEAHRLSDERCLSTLDRARTAACHVQIALAQGDLPAAARWAEQVKEEADASSFFSRLGLTPARLLLAQGQKAAAAASLVPWYERAIAGGWTYGAVEVRALQALAAPTNDEALAWLADGLAMAEGEGYIRTFVDKGTSMAALLAEASARGIAPNYVSRLLAAFQTDAQRADRPAETAVLAAQSLIEPLSDRERDLLPLLAQGRTYQEIAQTLCVSTNTVKTHLQHIYGKLGVSNRREAVGKARELELLT
jgi:LuxR family maltose regulon positive regulatory protein